MKSEDVEFLKPYTEGLGYRRKWIWAILAQNVVMIFWVVCGLYMLLFVPVYLKEGFTEDVKVYAKVLAGIFGLGGCFSVTLFCDEEEPNPIISLLFRKRFNKDSIDAINRVTRRSIRDPRDHLIEYKELLKKQKAAIFRVAFWPFFLLKEVFSFNRRIDPYST